MLLVCLLDVFEVIAFLFVTPNIAGTVVLEREQKQKYALNVMGLQTIPYWLGTFLFDYAMSLVIFFVFLILTFIVEFSAITDNIGSFTALTITFIFSF